MTPRSTPILTEEEKKIEKTLFDLDNGEDDSLKDLLKQNNYDINKPFTLWGTRYLLHAAARGGNADAVTSLLVLGAKVNQIESWFGYTALHEAAMNGHTKVVKILLKHEADPNIRSPYGFAAYDLAVNNSKDSVASILKSLTKAPPEGIRLKNEKKLNAENQEQHDDDDNDETDSISNNDQVDNVEEEVKKERKSARKSVSKKKSNVEE